MIPNEVKCFSRQAKVQNECHEPILLDIKTKRAQKNSLKKVIDKVFLSKQQYQQKKQKQFQKSQNGLKNSSNQADKDDYEGDNAKPHKLNVPIKKRLRNRKCLKKSYTQYFNSTPALKPNSLKTVRNQSQCSLSEVSRKTKMRLHNRQCLKNMLPPNHQIDHSSSQYQYQSDQNPLFRFQTRNQKKTQTVEQQLEQVSNVVVQIQKIRKEVNMCGHFLYIQQQKSFQIKQVNHQKYNEARKSQLGQSYDRVTRIKFEELSNKLPLLAPHMMCIFYQNKSSQNKKFNFEQSFHLIQSSYSVNLSGDQSLDKYKGFYLVKLNKCLKPEICLVIMANQNKIQNSKRFIYEQIIEFIIENTEQQEEIYQLKDNQHYEVINHHTKQINIITQSHTEKSLLSQVCQTLAFKGQTKIRLLPSFHQRLETLKTIMINNKIKKQPYLNKDCLQKLRQLMQATNSKKYHSLLQKLAQINPAFIAQFNQKIFQELQLTFHSLSNTYVGFSYFQEFEDTANNLIRKLTHFNKGKNIIAYLKNLMKQQLKAQQIHNQNASLVKDHKIMAIKNYLRSQVFSKIVQAYEKCLFLSLTKISETVFEVGKRQKQVVFFHKNRWSCKCQYFKKLGILCQHILRVLKDRNVNVKSYIDKRYLLENWEIQIQIQ